MIKKQQQQTDKHRVALYRTAASTDANAERQKLPTKKLKQTTLKVNNKRASQGMTDSRKEKEAERERESD